MSGVSDTSNTTTSPFSVGGTLKPGAGEQKITREQAAAILAAKLREAGGVADQADVAAHDKGGLAGALQGVGQLAGMVPDLATGVTKAIAGRAVGKGTDQYDKLAAKMAALLPDDALYDSVVGQIDRRQLYAQVMTAGKTAASKTVGGVTFDPGERALAGRLFSVEQDQAVTAATGLAAAAGVTGDAAVKAYVDQTAGAFRTQGTALGVSPAAPAALQATTAAAGTGAAQAGGSDQSFSDILNGIGSASAKTPFLTDADVQALFRLSSSDLGATNDYINSLAQYRANVAPGFADPFKVQAGVNPLSNTDIGARPSMLAPSSGLSASAAFSREFSNSTTSAQGARGYSITEAKDLLYSMSKDEVAKMQNLLLRAGYFADPSSGKSTKPLFMGDATDSTTQRGWLGLIGDAIRSGQPIFDTLSKKALDAGNKFSNPDGTVAQDVVLTSSASIAQDSDTIGQKEIGRKLTEDEHAKLVEFIHGLEKSSQDTANAPGAQTVENPDVQAEINKYLHDQFSTETQGKDTAEEYQAFTQMLAGPGGGR